MLLIFRDNPKRTDESELKKFKINLDKYFY